MRDIESLAEHIHHAYERATQQVALLKEDTEKINIESFVLFGNVFDDE